MKNLIILFFALNFQLLTFNCSAQWQQVLGPDSLCGLSLNCLSIATDGTNIFAATDCSIFLSTDDGNSWTNKGLFGVTSIVIDGTNIFAGGFGVNLSTDTGNSWSFIGLSGDTITSLAVSGTNIFAGANNYYTGSGGVFLSTDTGASWTPLYNGGVNGLYDPSLTSLLINGNNIFAGTLNQGVFLSTDSGSNWTQVNNGLTNFWIFSIGNYGSNIFVGIDKVFLSTDNGNLWTPTDSVNSTVWDFASVDTNIFAATSFGIYLSTNGGYLWTAVDGTGLIGGGAISVAVKGNYIYAGTGYGIWRRPLSEILGIKENFNEANMLYPNPTNGKFTITQTNNIKTIEVLNVFGEQIYYSTPNNYKNTTEVDISPFPKGIYFVKINNGFNTQIEKMVVQ